MGVSSLINRVLYAGDGVTLSFGFGYYFFKTTDLIVYIYDTLTGTPTLQVVGTNYSVSGTPDAQGLYPNGANVVFSSAPASTDVVVIFRDGPEQQNYALLQNGQISSKAIVQQFDYLTLLVQRLQDEVARSVKVPDGAGITFDSNLPPNIALFPGNFIQVNELATGLALSAQSSNFFKVTKTYADFQTAALTNTVKLFTLPAKYVLTQVFVKHSIAFAGTSISAVTASIGPTGDTSQFIAGLDVKQTVADSAWDSVSANYLSSWASAIDVNMTLVSVGANLSALTAGSVDVYYRYLQV